MKYQLKKNERDDSMIEASYTWTNHKKETQTILAFVVHVDCLEDEEIQRQLSIHGSAEVEMKLVE